MVKSKTAKQRREKPTIIEGNVGLAKPSGLANQFFKDEESVEQKRLRLDQERLAEEIRIADEAERMRAVYKNDQEAAERQLTDEHDEIMN